MRTRRLALLVLAAAAACDSAPTPSEPAAPALTAAESRAIAMQMDETARGLAQGGAQGPRFSSADQPSREPYTFDVSYNRVVSCPLGGDVRFQGTAVGRHDPAKRDFEARYTATRTETACRFNVQGGSLQIDGAPHMSMVTDVSFRNAVMDKPHVTTHRGGFRWTRSTGETGTCQVDLTTTFLRTENTSTFVARGTACGRAVSDSIVRVHG